MVSCDIVFNITIIHILVLGPQDLGYAFGVANTLVYGNRADLGTNDEYGLLLGRPERGRCTSFPRGHFVDLYFP